jgi:hypothetical protein
LDDSIDSDFSREALLVEREAPFLRGSFHNSKQPQSQPSAKNEREAKNSRRKRIKKVVASSEEGELYFLTCIIRFADCNNVDDLPSNCSRPLPKPQLSRSLRRRPSLSMPGSLFPRSPSTEPDADISAVEKEQCIRFALHASDPQSHQRQKSSASTSGSSRRHSQIVSSSVKTAVEKFHIGEEDADSSILLPSPKRSPHVLVASRNLQSRRISSPSSPSAVSTKHKGKNHSVDFFSEECGDASGFLRVKGKEKELIAFREELYENERRDNEAPALSVEQAEHDHNSDKIRIKMLEEEIENLKQEVSGHFSSRTLCSQVHKVIKETCSYSFWFRKSVSSTPAASTASTASTTQEDIARHNSCFPRIPFICICSRLPETGTGSCRKSHQPTHRSESRSANCWTSSGQDGGLPKRDEDG